ncbi:MAG: hypothetical protein Q9221_006761 [Calogaya cf. arnoldii]
MATAPCEFPEPTHEHRIANISYKFYYLTDYPGASADLTKEMAIANDIEFGRLIFHSEQLQALLSLLDQRRQVPLGDIAVSPLEAVRMWEQSLKELHDQVKGLHLVGADLWDLV